MVKPSLDAVIRLFSDVGSDEPGGIPIDLMEERVVASGDRPTTVHIPNLRFVDRLNRKFRRMIEQIIRKTQATRPNRV
ncbi:hypothetical protein GRAN_4089 [Granulicella sibirica]|uniref:Uncharacterized protein n=1 Tax=Granulicella sibirica TaxID=2479048 RepID=A0A4Q0SV97_9BACT|nr:hypothetical protein GRAN_4089 [Granulicella sibirica]